MEIFTNFSHVVGKFLVSKNCIVMVIYLSRKGVTNVITMLWMIIKSRFNFEFFTLFCNGFTTLSLLRILRCWRLSAALAMKKLLKTQKVLLKLVIRRVLVISSLATTRPSPLLDFKVASAYFKNCKININVSCFL